jgi:6-pyruvoyltetrahydropterin/6-carboxytetrahydropterin synthase
MDKYELLLRSKFTASHSVKKADGSEEPSHRHDWQVEMYLEGDRLDAAGILADFTTLHRALSRITRELSDTLLNEIPAFAGRSPSTEMIAKHLHDRFAAVAPQEVRVTKVRVWETSECAAAFIPGATGREDSAR